MNAILKQIVIFDDDPDILSICSYILEEMGFIVHCFIDCIDIEVKVAAILPDVILMDNWIPDEGGIKATQRLKKNESLKKIPVIYFSANSDIQQLSKQAGADNYLAKPFNLEDLQAIIEHTLNIGY
ncbi:response regulator [Mucilaginibacter sp.]|uniref:response regulator n=1 Tax=Mucilaginibacter sp. TaxID=1882438 RepID=UPI003D0B9A43